MRPGCDPPNIVCELGFTAFALIALFPMLEAFLDELAIYCTAAWAGLRICVLEFLIERKILFDLLYYRLNLVFC